MITNIVLRSVVCLFAAIVATLWLAAHFVVIGGILAVAIVAVLVVAKLLGV